LITLAVCRKNHFDFNFDDKSGTQNNLLNLCNDLFGEDTFIIEQNGRPVHQSTEKLISNSIYNIWPKVLGGKGGFGSLLRSFGKQILISKNKEACRDLNGRRMRDVNNEQKLKEWMQKQLEKSISGAAATESTNKNNDDEKKEKKAKHYNSVPPPPSRFSDKEYDEQKRQIANDVNEAVQVAAQLVKTQTNSTNNKTLTTNTEDVTVVETKKSKTAKRQRRSDESDEEDELEEGEIKKKKARNDHNIWTGIDIGDVSSDSDDEDEKKK